MNQKKANILYSLIQLFYFLCTMLVFSFASAYLLGRGYSNTQIGIIVGGGDFLAVAVEQIVPFVVKKTGAKLTRLMALLWGVVLVCSVAMLSLPLSPLFLGIVMCIICTVVGSMQPSVNSAYRGYHDRGTKINFAFARGIGSAARAFGALGVGMFIAKMQPKNIPVLYILPCALLIICLLIFNAPNVEEEEGEQNERKVSLFREYPHFIWFIVGSTLLCTPMMFAETYLLQIFERVGGGSGHVGIAFAVMGISEIPVMLIHNKLFKKFGNRSLLMLSGWFWFLKIVLITFAPSPLFICLAEIIQFAGYAVYLPSAVRHVAHTLPKSEYMRGQALLGSSYSAGCFISSFAGGILIDRVGVFNTLIICQGSAFLGAVLLTVSSAQSYKLKPKGTP